MPFERPGIARRAGFPSRRARPSAPGVLGAHVRICENPIVSGDECHRVLLCGGNEYAIGGVPVKPSRQRIGLHRDLVAHGDGLRGQFRHRLSDPLGEGHRKPDVADRDEAWDLQGRDWAHRGLVLAADQEPLRARPEPLRLLLRPDPHVGVEQNPHCSMSQSPVVSSLTRSRRMVMRPLRPPRRFPRPRGATGWTVTSGLPRSVISIGSRVRWTSFSAAMHLALNSDTSIVFMMAMIDMTL